jgi:hypothetical protein
MTTLVLVLVILLVALMIPLTAVILDSQVGRALAARLEGRNQMPDGVTQRIGALEGEVERLNQSVEQLREESAFLQRLIEEKTAPQGLIPPRDRNSG